VADEGNGSLCRFTPLDSPAPVGSWCEEQKTFQLAGPESDRIIEADVKLTLTGGIGEKPRKS